jgi:hypothetical protein
MSTVILAVHFSSFENDKGIPPPRNIGIFLLFQFSSFSLCRSPRVFAWIEDQRQREDVRRTTKGLLTRSVTGAQKKGRSNAEKYINIVQ